MESDSLYEKIDDIERQMDDVRYEAEPNKYNPLHDSQRGMSENPLYQSGGPTNPKYDVPATTTGARPLYAGTTPPTKLPSPVPEVTYMDPIKSPEELPSNSIPMAKYLEPPKSPPDFTGVSIPLERYSGFIGSSGEDVYEAMDGSNA